MVSIFSEWTSSLVDTLDADDHNLNREEVEPLVNGYPGCASNALSSEAFRSDRNTLLIHNVSHIALLLLCLTFLTPLIRVIDRQRSAIYKRFKNLDEAAEFYYGP